MGVSDRASILQDWTHHTFISCFLHILGAGEKSSPQETKCSIGFSANIADDTGYPHDGRADKNSYPHDGRADKDSNRTKVVPIRTLIRTTGITNTLC